MAIIIDAAELNMKKARPINNSDVSKQGLCIANEDKIATDTSIEKKNSKFTESSTQTGIAKHKNVQIISKRRSLLYKCPDLTLTPRPKPLKKKIKSMSWVKYHRLSVIYSFMENLERDYPAICTVTVIGNSVEGRAIKMLKISNSDAKNNAVWLDAAIHSREWIGVSVITFLADYIVRNFTTLSPSMINKDWHIVPVMNPDGYEYTHTTDRMWRKNKACCDGQCVGVDLNRNFSYGWGVNGEDGSSEEPTSPFYRGPAPFSEPETMALRDVVMGSQTAFKVFLSFHSYYELIIFPWGCRPENPPHYLNLLEGAAAMSRAIYETTGKCYKVGSTKDLTYNACGTSTDWSYSIAKIPYSYMIELRSKKHKFKLPASQILDTCLEIRNAIIALMEYVDNH